MRESRSRRGLLVCSIGILATGCVATSQAHPINPSAPPLPPTCPVGITVYGARSEAPADYKEIALLTSPKSGQLAVDLFKKRAAEVGATGVIFGSTTGRQDGVVLTGSSTVMPVGTQSTDGLAIYSASDDKRVRAMCGTR